MSGEANIYRQASPTAVRKFDPVPLMKSTSVSLFLFSKIPLLGLLDMKSRRLRVRMQPCTSTMVLNNKYIVEVFYYYIILILEKFRIKCVFAREIHF